MNYTEELTRLTYAVQEAVIRDPLMKDEYETALQDVKEYVEEKTDYYNQVEDAKNRLYLQGYKIAHLRNALTQALTTVQEVIEDYDAYIDSHACTCKKKTPNI